MKRIWAVLAVVVLCLCIASPAYAADVPSVDREERVHDFAGLLTRDDIAQLTDTAKAYGGEVGVDLHIVVAEDSLGKSPREYCDSFILKNRLGVEPDLDVVLFYANFADRDIYIATSGLGITYFYDSDIDALLDDIADAIYSAPNEQSEALYASREFLEGAYRHMTAVRSAQSGGGAAEASPLRPGGQLPSNYFTYDVPLREQYGVGAILGVSLMVGILAGGVGLGTMVILHKRSLSPAPKAEAYVSERGVNVIHRADVFLHTHTSRTAIPKNTSSGGGGGRSGGSSHRSGGHSFGGGGRKF